MSYDERHDLRPRRAASAPVYKLVENFCFGLSLYINSSIRFITNNTPDTKLVSHSLGGGPEKNALYFAANADAQRLHAPAVSGVQKM
jgi:hypothetical protein